MAGRVNAKRVVKGRKTGGQFAEDTGGATNIPQNPATPISPVQVAHIAHIADVSEVERYLVDYQGKFGYWSENLALVGDHWTNCYPDKVSHRWGFGRRTCIQVGETSEH